MKTLNETLKYRNPELIYRIQTSLNIEPALANTIFLDLLRWLWLCAKAKSDGSNTCLNMPGFLLPIDWGWHEFLLHTKDYSQFCSEYFDTFIHHVPEPKNQTPNYLDEAALLNLLSFFEKNIGSKDLARWIKIYPALVKTLSQGKLQ